MISGKDIYEVLSAVVPLYVAMILAYGSVRWWKIFTPEQCSGINRFVAVFAVPVLSFNFIYKNDPYAMDFKFIAADSLQKVVIFLALLLWHICRKNGSLEWMITLFSLSTLPNTLVMGVPLLRAMYGDFTGSLMVQTVVLQSIVWYTLLLIMFEYRGAKILIKEQFPDNAGSIKSFQVESDVFSLSGNEPLQADAEISDDGSLRVVLRRSNSSFSNHRSNSVTSRISNLSGVEIYLVRSSRAPSINENDFHAMSRTSSFGQDVFSLQSSKRATTRVSPTFSEKSTSGGERFDGFGSSYPPPLNNDNGLRMFVWSSNGSHHVPKANHKHADSRVPSIDFASSGIEDFTENDESVAINIQDGERNHQMPRASVVARLILIMVWRKLIRNPNTYASILGLVWSLISFRFHFEMPEIISASISILSNTGLGMAMFSLGLFMALQPKLIACGIPAAVFAMAVRFLAGPAVVAATSAAVGLRGLLLRVSILQAALPQGIVPFVFAKEYSVHADMLSTAVIFGMVVSLPATIIYFILIGL